MYLQKQKNTWVVYLRTQNTDIFTRTSSHHSTYPFVYKILTRSLAENKKCTKPYYLPVVSSSEQQ